MAVLAAAIGSTTLAQPREARTDDTPEADAGVTLAPPDRAAVVIVLDGARWQDVLMGVDGELAAEARLSPRVANQPTMPRLMELARKRGAILGAPDSGTVMRASGPNFVSLPGYTEILGGHPPTACGNNECAATTKPTLADEARAWSVSSREVALFASWPDLVRVAALHPETMVVSAGRSVRASESVLREDEGTSDLLDRGAGALAWPGEGDYRPDRFTAPLATRYLDAVHPRFLFLSLGDTDEYAHRGDYARYLDALRFADDTIARIVEIIDGMGDRGRRTAVYVTADHGRATDFRDHGGRWPESSRSWLVALGDFPARGAIEAPRPASAESFVPLERHLADIAPTAREWLGLPEVSDPGAGRAIAGLGPTLRADAR
jgi:hypothetical protein